MVVRARSGLTLLLCLDFDRAFETGRAFSRAAAVCPRLIRHVSSIWYP